MDTGRIIRELSALPSAQQREIADFIAFLKKRYKKSIGPGVCRPRRQKLSAEPFVGIWQNRKDLKDSISWR